MLILDDFQKLSDSSLTPKEKLHIVKDKISPEKYAKIEYDLYYDSELYKLQAVRVIVGY